MATVISIALVYVLPGFSTSAAHVPAESYPAEFHNRMVTKPLNDASNRLNEVQKSGQAVETYRFREGQTMAPQTSGPQIGQ